MDRSNLDWGYIFIRLLVPVNTLYMHDQRDKVDEEKSNDCSINLNNGLYLHFCQTYNQTYWNYDDWKYYFLKRDLSSHWICYSKCIE